MFCKWVQIIWILSVHRLLLSNIHKVRKSKISKGWVLGIVTSWQTGSRERERGHSQGPTSSDPLPPHNESSCLFLLTGNIANVFYCWWTIRRLYLKAITHGATTNAPVYVVGGPRARSYFEHLTRVDLLGSVSCQKSQLCGDRSDPQMPSQRIPSACFGGDSKLDSLEAPVKQC